MPASRVSFPFYHMPGGSTTALGSTDRMASMPAPTTSVPVRVAANPLDPPAEPEPKFELGTWADRQIRLGAKDDTSSSSRTKSGGAGVGVAWEGGGSEAVSVLAEATDVLRPFAADDDTTPGSLITRGLRQQQEARQREVAAKLHGDDQVGILAQGAHTLLCSIYPWITPVTAPPGNPPDLHGGCLPRLSMLPHNYHNCTVTP